MSQTIPPINNWYNGSPFNANNWIIPDTGLTVAYANANYLKFPISQTQPETINTLTVLNGASIDNLDVSGKVGIGVFSPTDELEVNGTISASALLTGTVDAIASVTCGPDINSKSSVILANSIGVGDETGSIDAKIGINTQNPAYPLDIYSANTSFQLMAHLRNNQSGAGSANICFNVCSSALSETSVPKASIGLIRAHSQGVGDIIFCNDNSRNTFAVSIGDEKLRIRDNGLLQSTRIAAATGYAPTSASAFFGAGASQPANYGCCLGGDSASGNSYIASAYISALGANPTFGYNLILQPSAGNVGIGIVPTATLHVGGTFTATSTKSFTIDHPIPAKKDTHYLVHSCIEGPRIDLIYRGKSTLINGSLTINLDTFFGMSEGTFTLLVRDCDIYLTNNTSFSRNKASIIGNLLTIINEDVTSNDEITWLVIGERCDSNLMNNSCESTDCNGRLILEPLKRTI